MPKIVYVDMDGVIADFNIKAKEFPANLSSIEFDSLLNIKGFFLELPPIKDAIESIGILDLYFEVYILSTAPWNAPNGWTEKRLWIGKYLPRFEKRLILSHRKDLVVGDYLIDDRTKNGAENFRGEFIHFGTEKFPNWITVLDYLLKRENNYDS